jgi:chromosome segregation ATPase
VRIISKVDANNNQSTIFYALDLGSSYVTRQSSQAGQAEKFLQDFVTKLYEDEFGNELKDAEKMLTIATKQQERKKLEGDALQKELERKKTEQENLQRKLEENKKEMEKLSAELEKNKQDQSTASTEVDKNKKIVEGIRQKFSSID